MIKYNYSKVLKEYFNYLKSEEATIVYIVKNLASDLEVEKKWVDIVDLDCWSLKGDKPAFNYIIVELFDRKLHPKYPEAANMTLRKAITWRTAHEDMKQQRSKGIRGPMFLITCYLYNRNKGRKETRSLDNWNEEYGGFDYSGNAPTTTIALQFDVEPEWEYKITGIEEIDDVRYKYIKDNYEQIYSRICQERRVNIDWFFESYSKRKK